MQIDLVDQDEGDGGGGCNNKNNKFGGSVGGRVSYVERWCSMLKHLNGVVVVNKEVEAVSKLRFKRSA